MDQARPGRIGYGLKDRASGEQSPNAALTRPMPTEPIRRIFSGLAPPWSLTVGRMRAPGVELESRRLIRFYRCSGTVEPDAACRQEWQIVQSELNLRDLLP